ncbi:MAG TPA: hypothetical protein GX392_05525 [Clostridiales bacterium]|nr:hypothetical protein [Clostridiales bacterium]
MKIGTLFGIDIYINKIFMGMVVATIIAGDRHMVATIFLVVFIHELAHIIAARICGLEVLEIELYPFGGTIKIGSLLELNPTHEIIISLAGPFINIMISLLCVAIEICMPQITYDNFIRANLLLACFNMLPALPLDGGRAVRAILSRQIGLKRATNIMINGGIVLAIFLIISGIYGVCKGIFNMTIFFIAVFLIYSAIKEKKTSAYNVLRDITYKKDKLLKQGAMEIRHIVVFHDIPLVEIIKQFVPYRYHYIDVVDYQMNVKGSISEGDVVDGIMEFGMDMTVGQLISR